ncbi:MAG TPA: hypothetical protein PLL30_09985 [Candidatus Krumholzibacteria bacterium]|nr:hypothetical protein [Candidatus Krumholzibacteria bacterium]HPD72089.1 hypothetical protein [Candidatus Krumholzibacteria bacterium]HRY40979.1 hypothetical protein [Candidatus Krumholzibacteria bacterium]
MERFDKLGMLVIPNPRSRTPRPRATTLIATRLYCQHGHDLVSSRAVFDGHPGILIAARDQRDHPGLVALSPVFGDKRRISLDLDLVPGERATLSCPSCGAALPVHSPCECGADLVALFLTASGDFAECIGICDRVDCVHARITTSSELIARAAAFPRS